MKRLIKIMVCFNLLLLVIVNVSAKVQPLSAVLDCPSCGNMSYIYNTTRKFEHYETFPCKHKAHGTDTYKVYNVKETGRCDSCGYSKTEETEIHEFYYCSGRN